MANTTINTSRAKQVNVDIFNYDDIPLAGTYSSGLTPLDLTGFKMQFFLSLKGIAKVTYSIAAGEMETTFLKKTGAGLNILDMQKMWEDIRDHSIQDAAYKLVQVVTDPAGKTYVYAVYNINAKHY
jgi:hypothetical protein